MEKLRKQIYDVLNKHDREVNIFGAVTNDEVSNLVDDLVKLLAIPDVVPCLLEKQCSNCKYNNSETYHDKMWCRDCRQKDRYAYAPILK